VALFLRATLVGFPFTLRARTIAGWLLTERGMMVISWKAPLCSLVRAEDSRMRAQRATRIIFILVVSDAWIAAG
jgi:hypothetical protein